MGPARAGQPLVRAPLYQQLHELLSELLRSPEFGAGSQFLTERQVSERFGVSRPTANKVLAGLVSEGLLEFRKGVGTFVRGAVLDYDLRSLVSFTWKAEQAGLAPATKVLAFRKVGVSAVPPDVAAALQLEAGALAFYIERLRLAGDAPMIYERRWVPVAQCPALKRRDVLGSIYTFWIEEAGLAIGGADQVIRAVNIDAAEAELLGGRSRDAGFLVAATGWLADGRPLWTERTLYRGDAYEFHHQSRGVGRQATLVYRGRLSA